MFEDILFVLTCFASILTFVPLSPYNFNMKKLVLITLLAGLQQIQAQCAITISGSTTVCVGSTTTLTASGASSYIWMPSGVNTTTLPICFQCRNIYSNRNYRNLHSYKYSGGNGKSNPYSKRSTQLFNLSEFTRACPDVYRNSG